MHYWFHLISILVISITLQAERYTFSHDKNLLRTCIENYLRTDSDLKIVKAARSLTEIVVHRFHRKSHNRRQFEVSLSGLCHKIKTKKLHLFKDKKAPENLRKSMRRALENCVERNNLPRFEYEPQVLADILDYVLVDWPDPLRDMIRTQEGRSILRLYAYSAGVRLMSALRSFSVDYDSFHRELERIWMLRAQRYYDGRGAGISYFRHRFTTDGDRVHSSTALEDIHTLDDVDSYVSRGSKSFLHRNPVFNRWNTNQTLYHFNGQSSDGLETVLFRISAAEHYLQTHVVQCYRIIVFALELQMRGINTDEDDVYNGVIPYTVLPHFIQRIVWSDEAYQRYLTAWREHLQQYSSEELEDSYSREDLIILLALLIVQRKANATVSSTTTTTTTTSTTTTEFPDYEVGLKKGGVRVGNCGKYFLPRKSFRSMFCEQNQGTVLMISSEQNYGYIVVGDDIDQLMSLGIDQTFKGIWRIKVLTRWNDCVVNCKFLITPCE